MNLRSMKIAKRSLLCFGLIAAVVVALGFFAISQMANIRYEAELIEQDSIPGIVTSNSLALQLSRVRYEVLRVVAVPANVIAGEQRMKSLYALAEADFAKYKPMIDDVEERSDYEKLLALYHEYIVQADQVINLVKHQKIDEARVLIMSSMAKLGAEMNEFSGKLQDNNLKAASQSSQAGRAIYSQSKLVTFIAIVMAFSLTVLLSWLMARSLTAPMSLAVIAARNIASGDLTHHLDTSGGDEAAQLIASMSSMQDTLRSTLDHIAKSAEQLASSSEEMSAVMSESAKGLQQQNDEIEMAATAVTEMSHAVEEVASNAVATSSESKKAAMTARQGQTQLSDTLMAIGTLTENVLGASEQARDLAEQTRSISKVLDVIRAVAEQTNLLALNAAIEAARAGEAGRGFAVVADEVRSLAHRTGESTREIEAMIGSIQHSTDQTVGALLTSAQHAQQTQQQALSANEALSVISHAVSEIDERNMVIASAAEEQAQVAKEVDRNLLRIRDLSIQTSAGAEQTYSASIELSGLAVDLSSLVRRFKV